MRFFIILVSVLALLSCSSGSEQFKVKLPPEVEAKVKKINKKIVELENDLKFMVLKKEKASAGMKHRYITKQKKMKRAIKKLTQRRSKIFEKYSKASSAKGGAKANIFTVKKGKKKTK